jgi:hypothetical protein
MSRIFRTRRAKVLGIAMVAMAVAAVAFAYLAATGSGSGSGNVTAAASNVALSGNAPDLTAIGDTKTVAITGTNGGTSAQKVGTLSVTAAPSAAAATAGCPAGSFTVSNITVTHNEVPANGGSAVVGHADITFTDDPANAQNACIGTGTVALTYSAVASGS